MKFGIKPDKIRQFLLIPCPLIRLPQAETHLGQAGHSKEVGPPTHLLVGTPWVRYVEIRNRETLPAKPTNERREQNTAERQEPIGLQPAGELPR